MTILELVLRCGSMLGRGGLGGSHSWEFRYRHQQSPLLNPLRCGEAAPSTGHTVQSYPLPLAAALSVGTSAPWMFI